MSPNILKLEKLPNGPLKSQNDFLKLIFKLKAGLLRDIHIPQAEFGPVWRARVAPERGVISERVDKNQNPCYSHQCC